MTAAGTCVTAFAGTRLVVAWEGSVSFAILNALLPVGSDPSRRNRVAPHYRLLASPDGSIRLIRGGRILYEGRSQGMAAVILLDSTAFDLADGCRKGPLFHAAAVHYQGQGILMPGSTGAGKTTLAAWLAVRGWDYLTDEIACVDQESQGLTAFCRALHLKEPMAGPIVPAVSPVNERSVSPDAKGIYRSPKGLIVPVERIRPGNEYSIPPVRLILFPKYVPDADREITRLSPAQASARLMGCALNIRNLPRHGFHEISQLARRIPSYSVTYGRLDHLAEKIAALLDHPHSATSRHGAPDRS